MLRPAAFIKLPGQLLDGFSLALSKNVVAAGLGQDAAVAVWWRA
jgi:hypothetical protein